MPEARFDKAIVIGDACVDVTVPVKAIMGSTGAPGAGAVAPVIGGGGTSANTAVALRRLDVPTAFMGTLGADYGGRFLLEEFREKDINTELTLVEAEQNTVCVFAFIDPDGERHLWAFPRVNASYTKLDIGCIDLDKVRTATWVHASGMAYQFAGSTRQHLPELFRAAHEAGVPTSFDLNTRVKHPADLDDDIRQAVLHTLPYVRYLMGSGKDEFYSLAPRDDWRDSVRSFATGGRTAIARMGAEGSFTVTQDGEEWQKPFDIPKKNTTGAGDCFNAGFIAGVLEGLDLSAAVSWGNGVASYKIGGNSARHTPQKAQLLQLLRCTPRLP